MLFAFLEKAPQGQEVTSPAGEGTGDLGWRSLAWPSGVCLIAGVLGYFVSFYLDAIKYKAAAHFLEHVSTAFFVALILLLGLEYNAKKRAHREFTHYQKRAHQEFTAYLAELKSYREQVAEDVFEAVLGRIVPEPIVEEVKQTLRIPVIKSECEYVITFEKAGDRPMPPGYAVLRRDLKFRVTNLLEQPTNFPVRSYYTSDEDLTSAAWQGQPFHVTLEVDNETISPTRAADDKGFTLDHMVQLPPRGSAKIFLRGEEPVRIEAGRSSYVQSTPVDELKVSIRKNFPEPIDIEVQMHHPAWQQVDHDKNLDQYVLKRAFLPGQGFEVSWKKRAGPEELIY